MSIVEPFSPMTYLNNICRSNVDMSLSQNRDLSRTTTRPRHYAHALQAIPNCYQHDHTLVHLHIYSMLDSFTNREAYITRKDHAYPASPSAGMPSERRLVYA